MNALINIEDLSKSYGKKEVLSNVNLKLDNARVIGLCGPNGSGKTTLIKILVGLLRDYEGSVLIDNDKIGFKSKSLISYLPDISYFNKELKPKDAKKLYIDMYEDFNPDLFDELLAKMHLDENMSLSKMSKGMKEKFHLAITLARQAKIYIFDEPIAGVDPASRELIMETILSNYHENALIIIATHLISDIESILDEVIFLNEGRVTLFDNCDTLREETGMSINELFKEEFRWS